MQFSSWFSINPSYPEDYDYYRNIKDPQNNWHSTNGTLLDCMSDGVCTAIASDHIDFNYTHPDSGAVVVNMQVEDYWGGDYAAATLNHSVELFTVPDPAFQLCITDEMTDKNYTNINQITTLSCNSVALTSIEGVELLTSLTSLNITYSSVTDLSPIMLSSSLASISVIYNDNIYTIFELNLELFKRGLEKFIACKMWITFCGGYEHQTNCHTRFIDRCSSTDVCNYNYDRSISSCVPIWVHEETTQIEIESPFLNENDSWNNFNETETYACILGTSDKLENCISKDVISYEGKFKSWEYNNGDKIPIQIYFYAAKPKHTYDKLPLLIVSHGGGGFAVPNVTKALAAELKMFVISYSGPGRGPYNAYMGCSDGSNGLSCEASFLSCSDRTDPTDCGDECVECERKFFRPRNETGGLTPFDNLLEPDITKAVWSTGTDHTFFGSSRENDKWIDTNDKFFDADPDPRGSWMWGHAITAMRAITLASRNPNEIDMDNVAIYGGSAGGVATLLASSVDDRIKVAVPIISSLAIEDATASDNSFINKLRDCTIDEYTDSSPEWIELMEQVLGKDALIMANSTPTLFINGATDEFFPLNALKSTYEVMKNKDSSRLSIQYNRGHDFWKIPENDPPETPHNIYMRLKSGTYHWLKNHLDFPTGLQDNRLETIPNMPTVEITVHTANPDDKYKPEVRVYNPDPDKLTISEVNFYYSSDQGLSYQKVELANYNINNPNLYTLNNGIFLNTDFNNSTSFYFADVRYSFLQDLLNPIRNHYRTFNLSTNPEVPSIPIIPGWDSFNCGDDVTVNPIIMLW